MTVFVDTSGLIALMVKNDLMHIRAKLNFNHFMENDTQLVTSSYVILETMALLQSRHGLEAVWDFQFHILPILDVIWVDYEWHELAVHRLQTTHRKQVSLTDCLSFEVMDAKAISTAFTFDDHFNKAGYNIAEHHDFDMGR